MAAVLNYISARNETVGERSWLIGLGLLSLSMVVWAQTTDHRLTPGTGIDKTVTDRIVEDSELWRQSPPQDVDTGWRVSEPKPREGRVTWGYDSTYEQLRENRYESSGSPSFDYSEERSGTLLRFNF